MEALKELALFLVANYQALISGIVAVCSALIGLFLIIPSKEPEATLQKIVDFLAKFSKK